MAEKAELVGSSVPPAPAKDKVQVISTDASQSARLCSKKVLIGAGISAGLLVLVVVIAVVASGETCSPGWHSPDGGPCVENTCPASVLGCSRRTDYEETEYWSCPAGYVVENAASMYVSGLGKIMCEEGYYASTCAGLGATCDTDGGAFTFTGCLRECLRQPLLPCSDIGHACTARTRLWSQITCAAMPYAADRLCTGDAS
jgi:hypothetical protein